MKLLIATNALCFVLFTTAAVLNAFQDKWALVAIWDTVTNLAPEKVFFCFNHAKISTFNRLNSLNMPKKTKSTL